MISQVGTYNRTGKQYKGHFDIWIQNEIAGLVDAIGDALTQPPPGYGPGGWVNGNDYERSPESFGILPISQPSELNMLPYSPQHSKEQKPRHAYLATHQQTLHAVLPVCTKAERSLFRLMCSRNTNSAGEPDWRAFCSEWADHADGQVIFYKVG